jgi:hypothetical protein
MLLHALPLPLALLLCLAFSSRAFVLNVSTTTTAAPCCRHGVVMLVAAGQQQPVAASTDRRDSIIQEFLKNARDLGTVGMDRTEAERQGLQQQAAALVDISDPCPARLPLVGVYTLVYSAAPGGSSGKLGPFAGIVTQEFVDDQCFINAVSLGPIKITLQAHRETKNDWTIKVPFRKTCVSFFGQALVVKELKGTSGGVWKYLFYGSITDTDGRKKLVRVMETPSLFVLEQFLD